MDLLQKVFLLLLLVALSGVIVGFLPQLPLPLLQVEQGIREYRATGAVLSLQHFLELKAEAVSSGL